jgi:DNA-binding CsgD family transcriptional regulator
MREYRENEGICSYNIRIMPGGRSMHKTRSKTPRLKFVRLLLSPFELEVAQLSRRGFSRSGVAAVLGVSHWSVKVALRMIREKLGADWQKDQDYVWPEDEGRLSEDVHTHDAPSTGGTTDAQVEIPVWGGTLPEGNKIEFTGLQRFWLKPVLDRLVEEGVLKLVVALKEEVFAPSWLPIVYHRKRVRPAVYAVRDREAVSTAIASFLEKTLPERAARVLEQLDTGRGLQSPWRKSELPGRDEIIAFLREAFGEAGERAAARMRGHTPSIDQAQPAGEAATPDA